MKSDAILLSLEDKKKASAAARSMAPELVSSSLLGEEEESALSLDFSTHGRSLSVSDFRAEEEKKPSTVPSQHKLSGLRTHSLFEMEIDKEEAFPSKEMFLEEMLASSHAIDSHLEKLKVVNKEFCIRPVTTKSVDGQKMKGRFSSQVDPWVFQPKCQACVRELMFLRKQGALESDILRKDSRCRKCNASLLELSNQFVKLMRSENFRHLHEAKRRLDSEETENTKNEAKEQDDEPFAREEEFAQLEASRAFLQSELRKIEGAGVIQIPNSSKNVPFIRSCLDAVEDAISLYKSQDDEKTRMALRKKYTLFEKALQHWSSRVSGKALRKWKMEAADILERVKMNQQRRRSAVMQLPPAVNQFLRAGTKLTNVPKEDMAKKLLQKMQRKTEKEEKIRQSLEAARQERGKQAPQYLSDVPHPKEKPSSNNGVSKSTLVRIIRNSQILSQLGDSELEKLAKSVKFISFPQNFAILLEGQEGQTMLCVCDGEADIYVKGQHVTRFGEGHIFGEIALVTGEKRTASVIAASDIVKVIEISRDTLKSAIKDRPELWDLLVTMVQDRRAINEQYKENQRQKNNARVNPILKQLMAAQAMKGKKG